MQETFEFLLLALSYVFLVIDVLPAPGGVFSDRLQHSAGRATNRDFRPSGWNDQSLYSREIFSANFATLGSDISVALLCSESFYSGFLKSLKVGHPIYAR